MPVAAGARPRACRVNHHMVPIFMPGAGASPLAGRGPAGCASDEERVRRRRGQRPAALTARDFRYSAGEEPSDRGSHVVHLVWSTSQRARSSCSCSACVGRSGPLCVFAWRVVGTVRCEHRGATRSQASVCVKQCGDRHAFGRGEQDSWENGNALSVRVLVTTPSTDLRPLATRTSAARRRTRARSAQTRCPARSRRSSGPRRSTDRRR